MILVSDKESTLQILVYPISYDFFICAEIKSKTFKVGRAMLQLPQPKYIQRIGFTLRQHYS
jgi:hypothetical protein